ncbi:MULTISPECIES: stressosome-associated protein Prli42 [Sporosarcina]|nr:MULTISPECIES: stressosome-associated protein Prli42 [Sporosarcina]MDS9471132.1 stressosome-associated protein Prli42 [Sporosarcina pasteurii]
MSNKNIQKWIVYIMIGLMLLSGLGMGLSMM